MNNRVLYLIVGLLIYGLYVFSDSEYKKLSLGRQIHVIISSAVVMGIVLSTLFGG